MDRRQLLDQRDKSRRMMQMPLLPAEIKAKAKRAFDLASAALGLQDAALRKKLGGPIPKRGKAASQGQRPSSPPDPTKPSPILKI